MHWAELDTEYLSTIRISQAKHTYLSILDIFQHRHETAQINFTFLSHSSFQQELTMLLNQ